MNIPLINSNSKQDINTSLIAIRNAINELSRMKESASVEDLQRQINIINQQIANFNSEFSAINTHLNTIDTNILNLQPVDTVASGNLHSVTSNAVMNTLSNSPFPVYWQNDNYKSPLVIADTLFPVNKNTQNDYQRECCFRMCHATSYDTPYGANVDTDFFYKVYKIDNNQWIRMIAFDVRSNRIFKISKQNNQWGLWESNDFSQPLNDLTDVITPISANRGLGDWWVCSRYGRVVYFDYYGAGGTSRWNANAVIDLFSNMPNPIRNVAHLTVFMDFEWNYNSHSQLVGYLSSYYEAWLTDGKLKLSTNPGSTHFIRVFGSYLTEN